jgi:hypothetical protein
MRKTMRRRLGIVKTNRRWNLEDEPIPEGAEWVEYGGVRTIDELVENSADDLPARLGFDLMSLRGGWRTPAGLGLSLRGDPSAEPR